MCPFSVHLIHFHIACFDGEVHADTSLKRRTQMWEQALLTFLPFHLRGSGYPEGDEGEGCADERHTHDHPVSRAQRCSGRRRYPFHPPTARHGLYPRSGQAHC